MLEIPIKLLGENASLPEAQTSGSAGMDLKAAITEDILLQPQEIQAIPTGICIALPEGYVAQICSRSGLALKSGIIVLNAPGIIDNDYRGEIKLILMNLGKEVFKITPQMRLGQILVLNYQQITWKPCTELPETIRNTGGFGSTGL